MLVVTLGIHTNNIALNPARLMGPAIISAAVPGSVIKAPLMYSFVFLAGELTAVLIVARTQGKRQMKAAKVAYKETGVLAMPGTAAPIATDAQVLTIKADEEAFKAEVKATVLHLLEDLEIVKARYK